MGKPAQGKNGKRKGPLRGLLLTILFGILSGVAGLGEPLEDFLRDMRSAARQRAPSDQIVVVGIDDKSIDELERWPWQRRHHAAMVDQLNRLGAKNIFFDVDFSSASDRQNDLALAAAFARSQAKVTLPAHFVMNGQKEDPKHLLPIPEFRQHTELANINLRTNFSGRVRTLPLAKTVAGATYPSFAAKMAGVSGEVDKEFPIDFSIAPSKFKFVSASDVVLGRGNAHDFAGKTIIVGAASNQLNDLFLAPVYGMTPGLYFHAIGAETLSERRPTVIGWWPLLIVSVLVLWRAAKMTSQRKRLVVAATSILLVLAVQAGFEVGAIHLDVVLALLVLLVLGARSAWAYYKELYTRAGKTNSVSGLPTLQALLESLQSDSRLIVAKVHNFPQISSAFGTESQANVVSKLVDRLSLITGVSVIHQGDEGVFAWAASDDVETSEAQLQSLFEIFRMPLLIEGKPVDISLTFGIDAQDDASPSVRLGGALVAADKALAEGIKFRRYDPSEASETAWKLFLMGQLGRAVAEEDIWVAFQPKLDLASNRIVGAEALARWNHPDRGEIAPSEFVLAAEQNGRIDELTYYVLRRAVAASAKLFDRRIEFGVAVNISASLVGSSALSSAVVSLLKEYNLPPHLLTLEITETAALEAASEAQSRVLRKLQKFGVRLSIDDYGTGRSTMDYLKRIPASELKIDRSFINAIETSRTDRLMVQSTIDLAHSLGQKVVAEGVERSKTLGLLKSLGCDLVQGFLIGKAVPFEDLERIILEKSKAA